MVQFVFDHASMAKIGKEIEEEEIKDLTRPTYMVFAGVDALNMSDGIATPTKVTVLNWLADGVTSITKQLNAGQPLELPELKTSNPLALAAGTSRTTDVQQQALTIQDKLKDLSVDDQKLLLEKIGKAANGGFDDYDDKERKLSDAQQRLQALKPFEDKLKASPSGVRDARKAAALSALDGVFPSAAVSANDTQVRDANRAKEAAERELAAAKAEIATLKNGDTIPVDVLKGHFKRGTFNGGKINFDPKGLTEDQLKQLDIE